MKRSSVIATLLTALVLSTSLPTVSSAVTPNNPPKKTQLEVKGVVKSYYSNQLVIVTKTGEEKAYTLTASVPVKDRATLGILLNSKVSLALDASGNPVKLVIKPNHPKKKEKAPKKNEVKGVVKSDQPNKNIKSGENAKPGKTAKLEKNKVKG